MGKLIIYTGPMKSGKTTKLIEQYKKTLNKSPKTYMFKPKIDTRYSTIKVVDRDNKDQILSTLLDNINMLQYFSNMFNNFFIDEFQFLEGDIQVIRHLLDKGKNIYVAGLNLTAEGKPFGLMGDLMCLADKVYFLKGNCDYCGKINKGVYTLYEGKKNTDILVQDTDYKCVCKQCYKKYNKE